MIDRKLKEAMELLGGKAVVKDGDECYILLSFKEFKKVKQEGIEGLTKQELIDKINNDIASWKFAQGEKQANEVELEELGNIQEDQIVYEKA